MDTDGEILQPENESHVPLKGDESSATVRQITNVLHTKGAHQALEAMAGITPFPTETTPFDAEHASVIDKAYQEEK